MTKAVQLQVFVLSTSTVLMTPVVSACDVTSQRDEGGTQASFSSGPISPTDLSNAIRDSQGHASADDGPPIINSDGSISFAAEGMRLTAPTTKEDVHLNSGAKSVSTREELTQINAVVTKPRATVSEAALDNAEPVRQPVALIHDLPGRRAATKVGRPYTPEYAVLASWFNSLERRVTRASPPTGPVPCVYLRPNLEQRGAQLESDLSEKSRLSLEVFELKLRRSLTQKFAVIVQIGLGAHLNLVNQSKVNAALVRRWAARTQPEIQGGHDGFSITSFCGQGGQRCAKSLPSTGFGVTVLKQGGHLRSVDNRLLVTWRNIRTRQKIHARANLAPAWIFFPCSRGNQKRERYGARKEGEC